MQKQNTINKHTAKNTIKIISNMITQRSKLPMTPAQFITTTNNAAVQRLNNNTYQLVIGIKNIQSLLPNIKIDYFVNTIISCFHEERHLQQMYLFQQNKCDDTLLHMAHTDLISKSIKEAYSKNINGGYWHNINEIDAELYGIKQTKTFFHEYFPEINIDQHIINLINTYSNWYAKRPVNTISDVIQNLETAQQQSYQKPIALPIQNPTNESFSEALANFASDDFRRRAYLQAFYMKNMKYTTDILLDFIKIEYPWEYKEYPCLQNEWTDKIRNAEPPTFATLRKLNRITQLEELYGHLLD